MREWSIRIFVMGPNGEELPATIFDKVTYKLHPTFTNPTRSTYIAYTQILCPGGEEEGREGKGDGYMNKGSVLTFCAQC